MSVSPWTQDDLADLCAGLGLLRSDPDPPPPSASALSQVTAQLTAALAGKERVAMVVPDATRPLPVANRPGTQGGLIRITFSSDQDHAPAWSPGGDSVYYVTRGSIPFPEQDGLLMAASVESGESRALMPSIQQERDARASDRQKRLQEDALEHPMIKAAQKVLGGRVEEVRPIDKGFV